ncbi:MAG: hypothetical protein J6C62_03560 [Clostridia bacterium]|nr:hypothetical protein [Clostridia bacterium]
MSNQNKSLNKQAIGFVILLALVVITAFVKGGFIGGLHILSEIINIIGYLFVSVFKLIFSIPQVAEEVLKRIITTLLVLGLSAWWCVDDFSDKAEIKIVNIIAKIIVAILFTVLSWIGMF